MNLECFACGTRFRSMTREARHRHSFPALCKRNKRFAEWSHRSNIESMMSKVAGLEVGRLFMPVWVMNGNIHKALYIKLEGREHYPLCGRCIAGSPSMLTGELRDPADEYHLEEEWFSSKLRIEVPTREQQDTFEILLHHGRAMRAFARVGFVDEPKASDHLTGKAPS